MKTFTQPELYKAVQRYLRNKDALLAKAVDSVVEWKHANDEMFGLFPLFEQIGFRGSTKWDPAKRKWLSKEPAGTSYKHGLDSKGRVRLIHQGKGWTTLFTYSDQVVEQMRYGPRCNLKRYILEGGRTVAMYDYNLDPHQYKHEIFEYGAFDQRKCLKSVQRSWFSSKGGWESGSTTTCFFEYDSQGLFRVFLGDGEEPGAMKISLIYARPKPKLPRKVPAVTRRPFVGYTLVPPPGEDPAHSVYCDAYGLEMNIDDEWAIDTVLLAPPPLVEVVTKQTGVTSMGTVYAGASSMPAGGDLKKIKAAGGKWILLDAAEAEARSNVPAILKAKLGLIVICSTPQQVANVLCDAGNITAKQLVIAIRLKGKCSSEAAQTAAAGIRRELKSKKLEAARVVIASRVNKDDILEHMAKPDIDGVLLENGDFGTVMDILVPIALNSQISDD